MVKESVSYEEALSQSVNYFGGDELAAKVFLDKYALRDSSNNLLESTPDQMHKRIAGEFARIESKKFKNPLSESEIYSYLDQFKYIIPQGSPMFGIGNDFQTISLSNCFVLQSPLDSYSSILQVDEQLVNISKRRGGVGIDLSNLRPAGTVTKNAARTSTGIVSFMERYSNSIREVGQCIAKGQRVLTNNGLKPIEKVTREDLVWTKNGWVKVLKVLANGSKPVYKVTSQFGYEVITSQDHIYQTFDSEGILVETKLQDLKVKDNIVLCLGNGIDQNKPYVDLERGNYKNSNFKPDNCILPDKLEEKLAYILGYSYGDGNIDRDRNIDLACSNDYPTIKTKLTFYVNDVFDYRICYRDGDGDLEKLAIHNKTIVEFLKLNQILKQKTECILFPEKIINSPVSVQVAFLSGYFDADGCATNSLKKGYVFSSVCEAFLKECQKVLLSIGVQSKIRCEIREHLNWKNLFSLSVVGKSAQQKFVNYFVYSEKISTLKLVSKRDCWLTPFKAKSFHVKHNNYSFCPDNTQYLSLSVTNKLKELGLEVCNNLITDTVKSIENCGEAETFDLVLEKEHLFWCEGFYLHNSGRRGALMLTLSIHHPDILDFVTIKNNDTKVTGANISVKLTQEFLDAVKNNADYELRWPVNNKKPKILKQVSAKLVWDKIIHSAWSRAEPGLLMWDNILKGPADCYDVYRSESTNPCLPKWSKLLTPFGVRELQDIRIGDKIWSKEGWTTVINKWSNGIKKVYSYETTGGIFYSTENHRVVSEGEKVEARDAKSIDFFEREASLITASFNIKEVNFVSEEEVFDITVDNESHTFWCHGANISNCCFSKNHDVHVITQDGIKEIKKITKNDLVYVQEANRFVKTSGYFDTGKHPVFDVCFSNGDVLRTTLNHKFCIPKKKRESSKLNYYEGDLVPLSELKVGDEICVHTQEVKNIKWGDLGNYEEGILLGWLAGDGCLSFLSDIIEYPSTILTFWPKEFDVASLCEQAFKSLNFDVMLTSNKTNNTKRLSSSAFTEYFINKYRLNIWNFRSDKLRNPFLDNCSREFFKGYIQSYFSADGTVCCNHEASSYNVQVSCINKNKLKQIQYLLQLFGIKSSLGLAKKGGIKDFKDRGGLCLTQDLWRLSLTGIENLQRFSKEFGFLNKIKQEKLNDIVKTSFEKKSKCQNYTNIINIISAGEEETGCVEVDDYHKFTANTIISGNSEIAMQSFDSCRLLCLNLYSYVNNPFSKKAFFDYELFFNHSKIAQRLIDNLVDLESEKIDKILEKISKDPESLDVKQNEIKMWEKIKKFNDEGRRTGTGITALGDTLAALNIKYGSKESIEITDKIYKTLKLGCYESSVDMAEEIGPFMGYEANKEKDCEFIQQIKKESPSLYNRMLKFGRRNIALLTTAPTGSVSILSQTTSGIEPLFQLNPYVRRKKINPNDKNAQINFVDQNGDSWQEFEIYHPKVKIWMNETGDKDIKKSPWYNCCAEDIDWINRVHLQSAAQKHVCHAISSTINLPENVSEERVGEIYQTAFNSGCKGITVYRKNCRTGVLVDKNQGSEKKIPQLKTRPDKLVAEFHHFTVKNHRYYVAVGMVEDKPYEVFTGSNHDQDGEIIIPKTVKEGFILKEGSRQYVFLTDDKKYKLTNGHNDPTADALTRLISHSLQCGVDISSTINQIQKTEGEMHSFAKVLARTLKKYIKDGTKLDDNCPSCQSHSLEYSSGCLTCKSCGWSKCA